MRATSTRNDCTMRQVSIIVQLNQLLKNRWWRRRGSLASWGPAPSRVLDWYHQKIDHFPIERWRFLVIGMTSQASWTNLPNAGWIGSMKMEERHRISVWQNLPSFKRRRSSLLIRQKKKREMPHGSARSNGPDMEESFWNGLELRQGHCFF